MPSINKILATVKGGKIFGKLDFAQAFKQWKVDDDAAQAQTIITNRRPYRVKCLQFGVAVDPAIFQKFMNIRLAGLEGIIRYYNVLVVDKKQNRFCR